MSNGEVDPRPAPWLRETRRQKEGLSLWEATAAQLAAWRIEDGTPIGPKLTAELRKHNLAGRFIYEAPHTFITVSLPKGIKIEAVRDMMSDMSHSWFSEAEAVLEGWPVDNPHMHLLTLGRPKKQNIVTCFSARFGVEKPKVDVKQSNCGELYTLRRNDYIRGNKKESKMEAVLEDREYRDAHQIPYLFTFFS